jgi:hypothetical protein
VLGPAGGLGAERRCGEHRGEYRSSAAHIVTSLIGRTVSISSLPVPSQRSRQTDLEVRGSGGIWKIGFGSILLKKSEVALELFL